MSDADRLWQKALRRHPRFIDADRVSLTQILERYLEEAWDSVEPPKTQKERIRRWGELDVKLPFNLAWAIYSKLKESRPTRGGRPPYSILEYDEIENTIMRGRKLMAELVAEGMKSGKAREKVAGEMADKLGRAGINIAAATLKQRLYKKKTQI